MTKKKEIEEQEVQEQETQQDEGSPAIFIRKVEVIVCNDDEEPKEENK